MKNKVSSFVSSGLVLGALALGVITSPVKAIAEDISLGRAEIPFSFQVGGTVMPAGSYLIKRTATSIIELMDRNTGHSVLAPALADDKKRPQQDGAVVFAHYGEQYFLRRVDVPGNKVAYKCWPGKKEQSLMRGTTAGDQSAIAMNTQPVVAR